MDHQEIVVGHGSHILLLDGLIPDFQLSRIAGVQLAGVKGLGDGGGFHSGVGLPEDVSLSLLAPVVFHAGVLHSLADGAPSRLRRGAGV